jgi:uncharacterized membrane protein HdeD (DUF308 family)
MSGYALQERTVFLLGDVVNSDSPNAADAVLRFTDQKVITHARFHGFPRLSLEGTVMITTTATITAAAAVASALRRLYFVRFGFALIWAAVLFSTASSIGPVSATLLVIYPLFDVAAAVVDARSSRASRSARGLYLNIAISVIAAGGLLFAVTSGIPAVLRVWGVWAVAAGLVQLVVAQLRRRDLGGQWAMIASGAISTLAGISFLLQAAASHASLSNLAGYALLGGIFFLVSALRLGRKASRSTSGSN